MCGADMCGRSGARAIVLVALCACAIVAGAWLGGCGGGGGKISSTINGAALEQGAGGGSSAASVIVYKLELTSLDQVELHSVGVDGTGDVSITSGSVVNTFDALDSSGMVVYSATDNRFNLNGYDIYKAVAGTAGVAKLQTSGAYPEYTAKLLPDASKIYYFRSYTQGEETRREIFRCAADGTGEEPVTNSATLKNIFFSISGNGAIAAYSDMAPGSFVTGKKLYIYNVAAATETLVATTTAAAMSSSPFVSPDGARLAYFDDCTSSTCKNLVFITTSGQVLKKVTGKVYPGRDYGGVWSTDGSRFAVAESGNIVVYSAATWEKTTVLSIGEGLTKMYFVNDWSDDGAKFAGIRCDISGETVTACNVITFNSDGTGEKQITSYTGTAMVPGRALFAKKM